jgi:hypothetical protein
MWRCSGPFEANLTPKIRFAMNCGTGSVFDHLPFNEAEFLSKFRVDGHPFQCDALAGTTLHDPPMIAAASSTPWFMKAIGVSDRPVTFPHSSRPDRGDASRRIDSRTAPGREGRLSGPRCRTR